MNVQQVLATQSLSMECFSLFGVAVATTPKGALLAKSPFGNPMAPCSAKARLIILAKHDT